MQSDREYRIAGGCATVSFSPKTTKNEMRGWEQNGQHTQSCTGLGLVLEPLFWALALAVAFGCASLYLAMARH
jgi:hypothetical protein